MAPGTAQRHVFDDFSCSSFGTPGANACRLASRLVLILVTLVIVVGCTSQAAPNLTIGYTDTPVATNGGDRQVPSATTVRRPTRLPNQSAPTTSVAQGS